jgi:membrane protein implicated in regulation of membrane protease activity
LGPLLLWLLSGFCLLLLRLLGPLLLRLLSGFCLLLPRLLLLLLRLLGPLLLRLLSGFCLLLLLFRRLALFFLLLRVRGGNRPEKQEQGGRRGRSYELHSDGLR